MAANGKKKAKQQSDCFAPGVKTEAEQGGKKKEREEANPARAREKAGEKTLGGETDYIGIQINELCYWGPRQWRRSKNKITKKRVHKQRGELSEGTKVKNKGKKKQKTGNN